MSKTTIETSPTGLFFDFANPQPSMISVRDIARSLSQQCRFGGHTDFFYSVAEHALLVYQLVREVATPDLAYAALHHDSHEAYVGDIPTPLKYGWCPAISSVAAQTDRAIGRVLGVDDTLFSHDIIKAADETALRMEASALKNSKGTGEHWTYDAPWSEHYSPVGHQPLMAEKLFLQAHHQARHDAR